MRFASVCSGIEAASVAWHPLGWTSVAFAEVDAFPSAVLAHRFPEVRNCGDFTKITTDDVGAIDLLVGGTPCQSFSVAGKRAGLDDPRGVLAFEFIRLAQRTRPRWVVFENVPGLLSSRGGADFGDWLTALAECGYGWAYRVLDAQHFGVPQRRRRVFVVGYLGDWRPPAAVLLEPESMRGDPPPRREAGKAAPTIPARRTAGGGLGTDFDCDGGLIAHALRAEGCDASEDGTGRGTPLVTVEIAPALTAREGKGPDSDATTSASVRRLTPKEAERLQGFPDDWTLVPYRGKPAADGPRYRAIGNSMATPVMRWIGERISLCERALSAREVAA